MDRLARVAPLEEQAEPADHEGRGREHRGMGARANITRRDVSGDQFRVDRVRA